MANDPAFRALDEFLPDLSFFDLLGCTRSELAHSRAIATLFDRRRHRHGEVALRKFLARIEEKLQIVDSVRFEDFRRVVSSPWKDVRVRREHFDIDVSVMIRSATGTVVIAIENKIDAVERRGQVADYQHRLMRIYPILPKVIIFLTPTGREPSTHDPSSGVPCVSLDYSAVRDAVQACIASMDPGENDTNNARVLKEVCRHLTEEVMADQQIRHRVRELWREHPRALQLAMEYRPRLVEIRPSYRRRVREVFGEDVQFYEYSERHELLQIQMSFSSWNEAGLPLIFILEAGPGERPKVRAAVWGEQLDKHKEQLGEWAREVNSKESEVLIDEHFSWLGESRWHRVFLEERFRGDIELDAALFTEETVNEAVEQIAEMVAILKPHVDAYLEHQSRRPL